MVSHHFRTKKMQTKNQTVTKTNSQVVYIHNRATMKAENQWMNLIDFGNLWLDQQDTSLTLFCEPLFGARRFVHSIAFRLGSNV